MMFPSCTHPEPSASFAASGVKTQAKVAASGFVSILPAGLVESRLFSRLARKPG
jgi:hypothetical protein